MSLQENPPETQAPANRLAGRRGKQIRHFVTNAPFAIAASSLPGAVNYFIVVYLAYQHSLADTGTYRTLFSFYALLGLASMMETNKVFIRSIVADDHEATTALFANRMLFSWTLFLIILGAYFCVPALGWGEIPLVYVLIAALATITYPFDSYLSLLQARSRFIVLFLSETIKYVLALGVFLLALHLGAEVQQAILFQLAAMALCHVFYFTLAGRHFIHVPSLKRKIFNLVRSNPARQARSYSLASIFPASLEHIDKIVVGLVFGLEVLGTYTLAYSTGRFVYNTIKPAMYIYYRRFVDKMPSNRVLIHVSVLFTLLGVVSAAIFIWAILTFPDMKQFESGSVATIILFLSYGVGILHALYSQAFFLNKDSNPSHALASSFQATAASLGFLGIALLLPPHIALIPLALQYPLRDGLSTWLMVRYRRQEKTVGDAKSRF